MITIKWLTQKFCTQLSRDSITKNNEGKTQSVLLGNKNKTNGFSIAQDIELDLKI